MKYTPDPLEVSEDKAMPQSFKVYQNSPNPFNAQTTIPFSLSSQERVKIAVFDVLGRNIRTLADKVFSPGNHAVLWDGTDSTGREVTSGIFFYKLIGKKQTVTKKMLFLK